MFYWQKQKIVNETDIELYIFNYMLNRAVENHYGSVSNLTNLL